MENEMYQRYNEVYSIIDLLDKKMEEVIQFVSYEDDFDTYNDLILSKNKITSYLKNHLEKSMKQ